MIHFAFFLETELGVRHVNPGHQLVVRHTVDLIRNINARCKVGGRFYHDVVAGGQAGEARRAAGRCGDSPCAGANSLAWRATSVVCADGCQHERWHDCMCAAGGRRFLAGGRRQTGGAAL